MVCGGGDGWEGLDCCESSLTHGKEFFFFLSKIALNKF